MNQALTRQETVVSLLPAPPEHMAVSAFVLGVPTGIASLLASGYLRQPGLLTTLRSGLLFNPDTYIRWLNYGAFLALPFGIGTALCTQYEGKESIYPYELGQVQAWTELSFSERMADIKKTWQCPCLSLWVGSLVALPIAAVVHRVRVFRFLSSATLGSLPIMTAGFYGGVLLGAYTAPLRLRDPSAAAG